MAIKRHFNSANYNYWKYNKKIRLNKSTYDKRRDKFFFEKISKKYYEPEIEELFLSNILNDPNFWVGNTFRESAQYSYKKWQTIIESIFYLFKQDFERIIEESGENFLDVFRCIDSQHPLLFKLYIQDHILIESVVILNHFLNLFDKWRKKCNDPIILISKIDLMEKYSPFLLNYIDKNEFRNYIKEKMIDNI